MKRPLLHETARLLREARRHPFESIVCTLLGAMFAVAIATLFAAPAPASVRGVQATTGFPLPYITAIGGTTTSGGTVPVYGHNFIVGRTQLAIRLSNSPLAWMTVTATFTSTTTGSAVIPTTTCRWP